MFVVDNETWITPDIMREDWDLETTVLLISFVTETDSTPGHLVHDFYKCESEYFQAFFKRCKRNLPNHRNSALSAHSPTNLVVMVLTASLTLLVSRT